MGKMERDGTTPKSRELEEGFTPREVIGSLRSLSVEDGDLVLVRYNSDSISAHDMMAGRKVLTEAREAIGKHFVALFLPHEFDVEKIDKATATEILQAIVDAKDSEDGK